MKKRYGLLLALALCGGLASRVMASTVDTPATVEGVNIETEDLAKAAQTDEDRATVEQLKKEGIRSIFLTPNDGATPTPNYYTDIHWTLNTFVQGSTPTMFLGVDTPMIDDPATYALAQATVSGGKVLIQPLADQAILNGAAAALSPLNGQIIGSLAYVEDWGPVVVVTDGTLGKNVFFVSNPVPVTPTILKNDDNAIMDAEPKAVDSQIVSVAASDSYIFAVVPANGKTFSATDGLNRGIAVLSPGTNKLDVLNASNLADTTAPKAEKINLTVGAKLVAFDTTAAKIGDDAVYSTYDSKMGRMYVCLTGITAATAAACGALGIFTARVDASTSPTKLALEPFVFDPKAALFTDKSTAYIVGFYSSDNTAITVSTKFPRVMHTSTGRDYLIIQSTVNTTVGVYALPLLPNDASIADANKKGTLAAVDAVTDVADFTKPPADAATMVKNNQIAVSIPFTPTDWAKLTDIFVEGDSVFFCLNSDTPVDCGVYRCTAIFDGNGSIINWTAPRRVTGDLRHVWGGAIDNRTGNIYCIAAQNEGAEVANNNTVRVTQWGKSDAIANNWDEPNDPNTLSSVLSSIFSEDTGSIHQIVSFDDETPGFLKNKFAMMVALGFDNIAMIQTGYDATGFYPFEKFTKDSNVFSPTDNTELKAVGPLCCCELSRIDANDSGWLMVGGYKGAAVLRDSDGKGFKKNLDALDNTTYPGGWNTFYFRPLVVKNADDTIDTDFANIRKIVSVSDAAVAPTYYFFIFTPKNIYWLEEKADNFSDDNIATLTLGTDIWKLPLPTTGDIAGAIINDAIGWSGAAPAFLLATTKGLFKATINLTSHAFSTAPIEIKMKELDSAGVATNVTPSLPVVHLSYISKDRGNPGSIGNLFVLCSRVKDDKAKIYRFYVKDGVYTQVNQYDSEQYVDATKNGVIPTPFIAFTTYRGNIISDGAILYHQCAKHLDRTDYFNAIPQGYVGNEYDLWGSYMSSIDTNTYRMVGALIQEGAFGGWMFPTDSGMWVNL